MSWEVFSWYINPATLSLRLSESNLSVSSIEESATKGRIMQYTTVRIVFHT